MSRLLLPCVPKRAPVRQRFISSIGVVFIGIVPTVIGGPVFALVLFIICVIGYREYLSFAGLIGTRPVASGYLILPIFALSSIYDWNSLTFMAACALAIGLPLAIGIRRATYQEQGPIIDWALSAAGTLYLGIPLASGGALRALDGTVSRAWFNDLASFASFGWDAAPRGLAWILVIILLTWLGDTGAFLIGRTWGRHRLIPAVSPKKTVEGAVGGMIASALTAMIAGTAFGLQLSPLVLGAVGLLLGTLGQMGDLAESLMKRQAGVKDSGTFIRGHGGVLDRVDALLITLAAGLYIAVAVDRWLA